MKLESQLNVYTLSGVAPFTVNQATLVTNLNAQYLEGQIGSYYRNAGNLDAGALLAARLPAFTGGDVTSTAGTVALTLAFAGTAGTYRSVTTDAKGRVTAGTNPTTLAGYGITDALLLSGGTLTGELVINYSNGRQRITDGTNTLVMGLWDTVNVRIEANGRPLYMVSYGGSISIGRSSGTNLVIDTASVSWGSNALLHAGNYTSYPPARWATGRTISLTGDVTGTSVAFDGTTALSFAATLANSGATAGTYNNVTVNAKGLVTGGSNASYLTSNQSISISGDATGSGSTGIVLTLANVLATPGTYTKVTSNAKGLITAGTSLTSADLPTYTGTITSGQVTTGLGFTPAYGTDAYQSKSLDTVSTPGLYQYDGAFGGTKPPDNQPNYRTIEIGSGSRWTQVAFPYASDGFYFRRKTDAAYSSWRTVLHDGNYNSYSPTLGGTGATGNWPISITGNASGSSGSCTGNAATATGQQSGVHFTLNTGGAGYGLVGQYNPDLHQGLFAMGSAYTLGAGGTLANFYGVSWSYDNTGRQLNTGYGLEHCMAISNAGVVRTVIGIGIWTNGLIRANGAISSGGTITAAAFSGPLTGNVTGNVTGSAGSVAWTNVSGRPTAVSSFSNDSGYITSGSSISGSSRRIEFVDGPRNLSDRLPTTLARSVNWDFVGAATGNGAGNYAGVMTFTPWDGTSTSTGDSSYQLAFANQSGVNASGPAQLSIRNGINSTWNAWQVLLTSSNYTSYPDATKLPLAGGTLTGALNGTTAAFSGTITQGGNQVLHAGNFSSYALPYSGGTLTGSITATNHIGPGTGLTGTAPGLNIGGNANNITQYTVNQSVGTGNSPSFTGLSVINTITGAVSGSSGSCTGNAVTATNGFTVKPGWAGNQNLIAATGNLNSSVPSGFYEGYQATNSPSAGTWYNLINVRHSNTGNDHGFQLAMGYYDETLWSRTYQQGTGANNGTFTTWRAHLHSGNYNSYAPTLTGGGASGTWGINITGASTSCSGSSAQLNGQAASYYENRDTTAVGFSAGTLTLSRAVGNLSVSLDGRYITGNQTITLGGDLTGSGTTSITATVASDSVTNAKLKTMGATTIKGNNSSVANSPADLTPAQVAAMLPGVARAWVTFNENPSTGIVSINSSLNVSSITRINYGQYRVNFTTALADDTYAVSGTIGFESNGGYLYGGFLNIARSATPKTTTYCEVTASYGDGNTYNARYVHVVFDR